MVDLKNAEVTKDVLQNVIDNIDYNKVIIDYYYRFANDCSIAFNNDLLKRKADRLSFCNKLWQLDKYELQKIKDFKKTNLCHDKFCANCKKVKQASRMARYIPELENYKDNLYHLTLTVPNCSGQELLSTYKLMAKSFRRIIRYLDGSLKVKGVNFSKFHYKGAVRSLEVTFKGNSYHPHFHVGLVLNTDLSKKNIINSFSYNNRKSIRELNRLFCKEEILIQKVWYLLINGIKVTKTAIDNLFEGYSCALDKFSDNDYVELFKYISKDFDEKGNILTYDNFVSLYYGLYRVKQIQGYGCLYNINDDIDLDILNEQFEKYIQEVKKKESPVMVYQKPQDLILDSEYRIISRKSYFKYLRQL